MNLSSLFSSLTGTASAAPATTATPATTSSGGGLFGFLNTAVSTAGQVFTATQTSATKDAAQKAAALVAVPETNQSRTWMLLAGAAGLAVLLVVLMLRRK